MPDVARGKSVFINKILPTIVIAVVTGAILHMLHPSLIREMIADFSRTSLEGVVINSYRGCDNDLSCDFEVQTTNGSLYDITYEIWGPLGCRYSQDIGRKIKVGDKVKVTGFLSGTSHNQKTGEIIYNVFVCHMTSEPYGEEGSIVLEKETMQRESSVPHEAINTEK